MRAVVEPELKVLRSTIKARDAEIVRLQEALADRPTTWAYEQACKALHHWREEAARLGQIAGEEPRRMAAS
jgi:hypothetical protein